MLKNGYPNLVVHFAITRKLQNFKRPVNFGRSECSAYLHLSCLGTVSTRVEKQITSSVRRCYFAAKPLVVFTTRQLFPATKEDVLPAFQRSNIIYQYLRYCDSRYVGRTSQKLSTGSSSMYQRASEPASFLKIDPPFLVFANLPITQFPMILLLVNISWIINCAHFITITIDSLYFPLVTLLSISPLWRQLSLELFNLILSTKRIRLQP